MQHKKGRRSIRLRGVPHPQETGEISGKSKQHQHSGTLPALTRFSLSLPISVLCGLKEAGHSSVLGDERSILSLERCRYAPSPFSLSLSLSLSHTHSLLCGLEEAGHSWVMNGQFLPLERHRYAPFPFSLSLTHTHAHSLLHQSCSHVSAHVDHSLSIFTHTHTLIFLAALAAATAVCSPTSLPLPLPPLPPT